MFFLGCWGWMGHRILETSYMGGILGNGYVSAPRISKLPLRYDFPTVYLRIVLVIERCMVSYGYFMIY